MSARRYSMGRGVDHERICVNGRAERYAGRVYSLDGFFEHFISCLTEGALLGTKLSRVGFVVAVFTIAAATYPLGMR